MNKVLVLGSINYDYVIHTDMRLEKGLTVNGNNFFPNWGGKGFNQAVALKKLGYDTVLIGAVGEDMLGNQFYSVMSDYHLQMNSIQYISNEKTGVCFIVMDDFEKDNYLITSLNANNQINIQKILLLLDETSKKDILVSQFELPLDVVLKTMKKAKEKHLVTILNPSPPQKNIFEILKYTDIIICNISELENIAEIKIHHHQDFLLVFKKLNKLGIEHVIVTKGAEGVSWIHHDEVKNYSAYKVNVIDVTSAGDTFLGAFAGELSIGKSFDEAIQYAIFCSSLTVQRNGAAQSIPTKSEIDNQYRRENKKC